MEKIWLQHYPSGISATVDVNAFASLKDVLRLTCQRFADLSAYSNMGASMTYAELDVHSRDFAAYLQGTLGLLKGDRVAIMMPSLLQYPVALFGVLRAGLVVVNINPQYTGLELERQLKDSDAAAILVLENFAHTLQEVLDRHPGLRPTVITTEVGDLFPLLKEVVTNVVVKYIKKLVPHWKIVGAIEFNAALRQGRAHMLKHVPLAHSDMAFLQYTGGITGVAKGTVLTHGNMVANLQQISEWLTRDLVDGKAVLVCPLPLHHIYALTSCLVFMTKGAHIILITNPRDMPAFIHDLKKYPPSVIIGVNALYRALLDTPEFAEVDLRGLKMANAGGVAVHRAVAERWKKVTGVPIIEAYGLTEASPGVICNPLDITDWTGAIGLPFPSTDATVFDDDAQEVLAGEVGEICVKGPQVMSGYWNRPEETARAFTPDGWLRTGDMGFMDERGYFRITDRKKDMIIVSGFSVFPSQIEAVVALHPGVAEVAAIGTPDARSGEVVKIVVVRSDPALTEQALLAHCRQHLTDYKIPMVVEFRTGALPKSHLGTILRRQLRNPASSPA